MPDLPPLPPGAKLLGGEEAARVPRADPAAILRAEGFTWTNGFRTDGDTARIRQQGYSPAEDSLHLDADAIDLNHPTMSRREQTARLNALFGDWKGYRVIDEGHHRHLQLPGWGSAPGTPGTPYSGLPELPQGATLIQRGPLTGSEAPSPAAPRQNLPGTPANPSSPWTKPEESEDGKGVAYFRDERTPRQPLLPEIEAGYLALAADPNSTGDDLRNYARDNKFQIRDDQVDEFIKRRNEGWKVGGTVSYSDAPHVLIDMKDGKVGATARGVADGILFNQLDEWGGVLDTIVPGSGKPNIWDGDGRRFGDKLWDNIDDNRAVLGHDEQNYPWYRVGGQVAGSIVLPTIALEKVALRAGAAALRSGASMATARAAARSAFRNRLVAVGAGEGALAGFGAGEGGFVDRLDDAVIGGGTGAALGLAADLAIPFAKAGAAQFRAARAARASRRAANNEAPIPDELEELTVGPHGPIHFDLAKDYPAGLARLKEEGTGELPGAINHPEIGPIDLVWGNDNYGLSKIVAKHPEVADDLPAIVEHLPVVERPDRTGNGKFVLEDENHRAIVAPDWEDDPKRWLVTAFERKNAPGGQNARRDPQPSGSVFPGAEQASDIADGAAMGNRSGRTEGMAAEYDDLSIEGPALRAVDRIDVSSLPPLPGGARLLSEGEIARASPEDMAAMAERIDPEDMRPIPGNAIEDIDEAARANPGTFRDVRAPDPQKMLEVREIPNPRKPGQVIKHRGPIDAEGYLRLRGGIRDDGGELRHIGIVDNRPRPEARSEARLGRILNPEGMSLDDAGEALWEAGFFAERPSVADVVDMLRASRMGRRLWHPSDLDEVANFEGAQRQRWQAEAAEQEGSPLSERIGTPATAEDLASNVPPVTAYEDLPKVGGKVANINLAHLETVKDIRRALQNTEVKAGGLDAARRGRISNEETKALARELDWSVDDLLARRKGQAFNAEQALAARQMLAKSLDEIVKLAERATDGGGERDLAVFRQAWLRHLAIQEQVTGMTAEAGRALQQFKITARSADHRRRLLDAIVDGGGGAKKIDEVARAVVDLERDPSKLNRLLLEANKPTWSEKAQFLFYNWILSGPQTHAVNILSNAMTQGLQFPEHLTAAAIGKLDRNATDRVLMSEIGPRLIGMMQGAREGARAFAHVLKTGEVSDGVSKIEMGRQNPFGDGWFAKVAGFPTRMLAAEDEFFKATARRMEITGLAVRKARSEGLRGDDLRQRIADLTANPTEEMIDKSMDYARYLTFQNALGPHASKISALTQGAPILKLIIPFIRTPTNLLKYSLERSPGAFLLREVRNDIKAGGSRRHLAFAKMALGTGLGLTVTQLAAQGLITGGGPADENRKRQLLADGWQPYSIKIGDKYFSYQRFDPLSTTLGVAADLVDLQSAMTDKQREKVGTLVAASIIQNLSNKTWLSGLSDALEAAQDPQRYGTSWANRMAGTIAVPALVAQTVRSTDPFMREARTMMDAIKARIPGLSDDLPPQRDIYGRPIERQQGLGPDLFSPIWMKERKNDPVIREVIASGASMGKPARGDFTPEDYSRYVELAGRYTYEGIAEAITAPDWASLDPADRKSEIESIKNAARKDARAELFGSDDDE